jgi:hypothetical protein
MDALESSIREQFARFDEDAFGDWLTRGFKNLYPANGVVQLTAALNGVGRQDKRGERDGSTRPFDFAYSFVGKRESILEDMRFIYTTFVPDDKKGYFRRSIGKVLRRSVDDVSFPEAAISDLIYLVSTVRAYESLGDLGPAVARGRYGKDKEWLQYEAIANLKDLLPAQEAVEGLRNLVTQEHFHEAYAFEVLILLCRYEPERWSSSFDLLRGHFASLREHAHERGADFLASLNKVATDVAVTFAKTLPTNEIAKQVPRLIVTDRASSRLDVGMCFLRRLLGGNKAPITMLHDESRFSDDMSRVLVPIELAADSVRRACMTCETEQYRVLFGLDCALQKVQAPVFDKPPTERKRSVTKQYAGLRRKFVNIFSQRRHPEFFPSRPEGVLYDD